MLVTCLEANLAAVVVPAPPEPSDLPPLKYSALPTPTSIRLLNVFATSGSSIQCSLQIVDLDDQLAPKYDALSYTWGDSRVPILQSIVPEQYRRRHRIVCNNKIINVTENLYHALQKLAELKKKGSHVTKDVILQDHIWVDALCINQADVLERSSQVAIMDQIYSKCQLVFGWLGLKNHYTDNAVHLIERLSQSQSTHDRSTASYEPGNSRESMLNTSYELSMLTTKDWESILALFTLPYLRRVWIIQELALAPRIMFMWGDRTISWETILMCDRLLLGNGKVKVPIFTRSYFSGVREHLQRATLRPLNGAVSAIQTIRDPKHIYMGTKIPWYALVIMNIGRGWLSTDPRDHVFAVLGMIKFIIQMCPPTEPTRLSISDLPVPDYSKSTSQVYTELAAWHIKISGTLFPLMLVEDRSQRNSTLVATLPTWVPDFSVPLVPMPLFSLNRGYWDASGHEADCAALTLDGGVLVTRAAYFDQIEKLSDRFESSPSKESVTTLLKLVEPLAGSKYPLLPISYIEALWRTLVMDIEMSQSGSGSHPVSVDRRQDFNEWLLSRALLFEGSPIDSKKANSNRNYQIQRILLNELVFQAAQDPTIFACSGRTDEEHALNAGFEEHTRDAFSLRPEPPAKWEISLMGFVKYYISVVVRDLQHGALDVKHFTDALGTLTKPNAPGKEAMLARVERFRVSASNAMSGRRAFISKSGCIGLAGQSIAAGDQVWILAGIGYPVVLRPTATGRYEFVADTYIHGIMHGEAVKSGKMLFHDIDLQ